MDFLASVTESFPSCQLMGVLGGLLGTLSSPKGGEDALPQPAEDPPEVEQGEGLCTRMSVLLLRLI